ncbi:MlaD family protein [Jongsikchunia kroppenstedtii]|uniref:MlaD family protein n=1 Tax=Jongsikchunia kroppenstedtii TaxID=1121721 RepID=UPI0003805949|nr:MlaD family protein [Jongsikchunia kroppenstedtii]
MNTKTALSIAAMLVTSVVALVYMVALGLPVHPFQKTRNASMMVTDTNGLVVGSHILLRGIDIGEVTAIHPDSQAVRVDLKYQSKYRLPVDSTFRVDNLSALGETYISVLPSGTAGPYLANNDRIDSSRVTVPTTISELSARFTRLLNQLNSKQIQSIMAELNTSLPDGTETIGTIQRASALTAAMLDSTSGSMTDVLKNAQRMLLDSSFLPRGLSGAAVHILEFSKGFNNTMTTAVSTTLISPLPDALSKGTGPLLNNLQAFLDRSGSDIKVLAVDTLPAAMAGAQALSTINLGTLLDRAMAATSTGDAVTIHLSAHP